MLVLITTADTEILAAARAVERLPDGFPSLRCANPSSIDDPVELVRGARVVVVRLLGGRRAWARGFDRVRRQCLTDGVPLLAFGGEAEPEAELAALSSAPAGAHAQAFEYLRHGGVDNVEQLLRFLADTFLYEGYGFAPPAPLAEFGVYAPGLGDIDADDLTVRPDRPTVGLVFYRTHRVTGNTAWVDELASALDVVGANALCIWAYSLRPGADARVPALELARGRVDALITTVLASGGANAGDAARGFGDLDERPPDWMSWHADALAGLDVPVVQGLCVTSSRASWEASAAGLSPLDAAMQVAIPEFDGRIVGIPVSFKEALGSASSVGAPLVHYVADRERCQRLASMAIRLASLRRKPPEDKRIALVLSSYPTKHARIGNAVGLDTPASAVALLEAMRAAGYRVDEAPEDGDALIRTLVNAGGHDNEFLSDDQLARAEARLDANLYASWFRALPQELRSAVERQWGPPPGDLYVHDRDIVVAGVRLGNVFVAIQPPRGFGEDPIAIYHDPELAPTHHYLAAYWWLERIFCADALVHLGKHGTLEWLPGKSLGLSASCAPDATLGPLPLIYPFIVNDPGEGEQAKRRAHAVVIDHLIAPMMRAETYDELAELEQELDAYAEAEALDPSKLPALATRIWELVRGAHLDRDLGVDERPRDFSEFIGGLDCYLCEVKDRQVRDGLHVLGRAPEDDQLRGLVAAVMRLGAGAVPGLRRAIAAAFGLDESALLDAAGEVAEAPPALLERFPGPAARGSDLIDRLEEAQTRVLEELAARGFEPAFADDVCTRVLGVRDDGVERALAFAADHVVPRLRATTNEVANVLRALAGRFVPAGPAGSPTRGRLDVLPTGRNFYSVDPKALPSELSYEVGARLADDLLRRHLADHRGYPEAIGIVVWGTSAMRTQGDDIGEILALLGVRPVWQRESRRVTGLEVIPLEALGRPRIDVTVRISGFFRDAFPNLIALLDEAITTVAALDEPLDANYVRKHALADGHTHEADADGAWRRATTRIFGSKPGAYGAGLLPLIDARNWRDDADLAEVYEVWGGYAYGKGLNGVEARAAMRENFARIDIAVKNVDNREHDLFDSDDYFQYHGGMVATVRAITGREPKAWIGDSADPARVRTRSLEDEARRVFRSRVANPRWIASMIRHGYKGAFELSATVDYLFGYDATTGVVDDWMYETLAERYSLDPDVAAFMRASNPWAARAIAERLLEAADRGLWRADADMLERLHAHYLELEGELEDAAPAGEALA